MVDISKQGQTFAFIRMNEQQEKPGTGGITEIRAFYHTGMRTPEKKQKKERIRFIRQSG